MPLVRRKFVQNGHMRVTHRRRRLLLAQTVEIPMHSATTSSLSEADADPAPMVRANMVIVAATTRLRSIVMPVRGQQSTLGLVTGENNYTHNTSPLGSAGPPWVLSVIGIFQQLEALVVR